jgi:hypothetical protein
MKEKNRVILLVLVVGVFFFVPLIPIHTFYSPPYDFAWCRGACPSATIYPSLLFASPSAFLTLLGFGSRIYFFNGQIAYHLFPYEGEIQFFPTVWESILITIVGYICLTSACCWILKRQKNGRQVLPETEQPSSDKITR